MDSQSAYQLMRIFNTGSKVTRFWNIYLILQEINKLSLYRQPSRQPNTTNEQKSIFNLPTMIAHHFLHLNGLPVLAANVCSYTARAKTRESKLYANEIQLSEVPKLLLPEISELTKQDIFVKGSTAA